MAVGARSGYCGGRTILSATALASAVGLLAGGAAWASPAPTTLESVSTGGVAGNANTTSVALSADGRYVAFSSGASNLVPGDTNALRDIFVRDRQTGETSRESVRTDGGQSIGGPGGGGKTESGSFDPAISADGRFLAFASSAINLVDGDSNGLQDIFVRDRMLGTTVRSSVDSSGSAANGASFAPAVSADGCVVAFHSPASNLVVGDTNGALDVFVRDCQTSTTTRVSVSSAGGQGNTISLFPVLSADGRLVVFESAAGNLVVGDTNKLLDVFVHDRQTGVTTRESVGSGGGQGNSLSHEPSISGDGRYVVFISAATNLVVGDSNNQSDVFVRDRQTGTITRESVDSAGVQGNGKTYWPVVSADGRFVAYHADATNLVADDTNASSDVFVRDRLTGVTTRESVDSAGGQGNQGSLFPALSADGQFVGFHSSASNLVAGDTNGRSDAFVHQLG